MRVLLTSFESKPPVSAFRPLSHPYCSQQHPKFSIPFPVDLSSPAGPYFPSCLSLSTFTMPRVNCYIGKL